MPTTTTGIDTVDATWAAAATDPHLRPALDVAADLCVDPSEGLTDTEITRRRAAYGDNQLAQRPRRAPWLRFLDQFRSLLICILIGAASGRV